MKNHVICAFVILCGMVAMVTPLPMQVPAYSNLDPVDACLFICNICFDNNEKAMMVCANNICLGPYMGKGFAYIWLSKNCPFFEKLSSAPKVANLKQ